MKHRKPSAPVIYFFRGLNSCGDEILRLGPLPVGPYSKRILKALPHLSCINVEGLGRGSIEEMGERAAEFLKQDALFHTLDRPVHFFGHSMGGLIARYLIHKPEIRERVTSVVSLGTPHHGLPAAVPKDQSQTMKLIRRVIDNNVEDRSTYYSSCRPDSMLDFNRKYPDVDGVFYASAIGVVSREFLPLSLRIVDKEYNEGPSDGVVPETSQIWGQDLGKFRLDHLEQIGLCQDINPLKRLSFSLEFRRLCETLTDYWHSFPQAK